MASGKFSVIMKKLCQKIVDGEDMPEKWKTSVAVPIFKGKGDVMGCGAYRKAVGTRNEDCGERVGEQNMRTGSNRRYAIWLYAWERHNCLFCKGYNKNSVEKRKRCACIL